MSRLLQVAALVLALAMMAGVAVTGAAPAACSQPLIEDHAPVTGQLWVPQNQGMIRLINVWKPGFNGNQTYKYLLPAGSYIAFDGGGGKVWSYENTSACDTQAGNDFSKSSLPQLDPTFSWVLRNTSQTVSTATPQPTPTFVPTTGGATVITTQMIVPPQPFRVLDTRSDSGGPIGYNFDGSKVTAGPILAGQARKFSIAGRTFGVNNIPGDIKAALFNVTLVAPGPSGGFLRIYPAGTVSDSSCINPAAAILANGCFTLFSQGTGLIEVYSTFNTHLVLDYQYGVR